MQHRYTFEAIDCTFKNIRNDPRSFGDIVFCFYKDFRQILSIVSREIHEQIVFASLKHSSLWQYVQCLFLIINMHLFSPQMSPEKRLRQEEFANHILAINEDHDINNDIIQWLLNGIVL